MLKKIRGYSDEGKVIFEREARDYDQQRYLPFFMGIPLSEIIRFVIAIFCLGMVYANQQNLNLQMTKSLENVNQSVTENSRAILGIKSTLSHLDASLSKMSGHIFNDGLPSNF